MKKIQFYYFLFLKRKNILNDKSSSITESSIDYIPNKRKKISEEDNFYSLSMKEPNQKIKKKIFHQQQKLFLPLLQY